MLEDIAPQPHRDLGGRARDPLQPAHIEERLVDRQAFDQRRRVLEDAEDGLAGGDIGRESRRHDDRPRAQAACLSPAHGGSDAVGLGLVAGRQHDAPADDHRAAPQAGIIPLLDGCVERVQVGVQDRGVL